MRNLCTGRGHTGRTLTHFAHNAEYIAYYPNMPAFFTRETVYWAWLAVSSLGVAGLIVSRMGLHALGALLLMAYGACGLDGLLHYTLALCAEHTLATNLTIWFEVLAGLGLAAASLVQAQPAWPARAAPVPAACATSCSAPRSWTGAARCCASAAR